MPYECLLLPTGMEDAGYSGARRAQTTAAQVNESTAADEPRCKVVCKLVRADCRSARGRRRSQEPGQLAHRWDGTCQLFCKQTPEVERRSETIRHITRQDLQVSYELL